MCKPDCSPQVGLLVRVDESVGIVGVAAFASHFAEHVFDWVEIVLEGGAEAGNDYDTW